MCGVLSLPDYTIEDIWIYIFEKNKVRSGQLEKKFLKPKNYKEFSFKKPGKYLSRGTLYKYRGLLEDEGKIVITME